MASFCRKRTAFQPQIPVWYEGGKYVFDFASYRSSWITQTTGTDPISLNIGGYGYRCEIAYIPQSVMDNGGDGSYNCSIPFSVGKRRFATFDLMREFLDAGLPEFCHSSYLHGDPLLIREGPTYVASSADITCASIDHPVGSGTILTIELNSFASELASQIAKQEGPLNTLLCLETLEGPTIGHSSSGTATFRFKLSASPAEAKRRISCARSGLQVPGCR